MPEAVKRKNYCPDEAEIKQAQSISGDGHP